MMKDLPLYLYLIRTYSRFLAAGECLSYPRSLHIQTQSFCNARCAVCPYPTVSKRLEQGEMEWALFERITDQLASGPAPSRVIFELHNEPLLDKRILDCVRNVKSKNPSVHCSIVTNGELLDRFSADDILASGLGHLTVSLNAHSRETYERLNIGLSYDRVTANISNLLSNERLRRRVSLSYVATGQNLDEVRRARASWKEQGVGTRVVEVTNRTGLLEGYDNVKLASRYYGDSLVSRVWGPLLSRAGRVTGCVNPFRQLNILFNGDCIICCHDWNRATVVGNARTQSLREIWNSPRMNEVRRLVVRKRYDQIDACRGCSLAR
jgi:radical SAM protein with 4Fe4S-binding SPASM domain